MPPSAVTRVTVMARRKSGLTMQEFQRYLREDHGPLVAPWLKRHGVTKYTQYHKSYSLSRGGGTSTGEEGGPGSMDTYADFYVPSYEDFQKAFKDPFYEQVVKPDEEKILDMDSVVIVVGIDHVLIDEMKGE